MTSRLFHRRGRLLVLAAMTGLTACHREDACSTQAEQSLPGRVRSISGPQHLQLGATAVLTVAVSGGEGYCVRRAEAGIGDISGNEVSLSANLICTGPATADDGCGCSISDRLNALIYFTPQQAGTYIFSATSYDNGTIPSAPPHHIVVQ